MLFLLNPNTDDRPGILSEEVSSLSKLMTRHSKNNTAGAFFTTAEKNKLSYGTKIERLGKDSLRPSVACHVCLKTASTPVVCPFGHLFCRECILTALLEQKETVLGDRKQAEVEMRKRKREEEDALMETHRKKIEQFEAINSGKVISTGRTQQKEKCKSFWIPEKTPVALSTQMMDPQVDKNTYCPVTDPKKHRLTIKQLTKVQWKFDGTTCICILCQRNIELAKSIKVIKACGHVFCEKCLDTVFANTKYQKRTILENNKERCPDCNTPFEKNNDCLSLAVEGTGFASSNSRLEVSKYQPSLI